MMKLPDYSVEIIEKYKGDYPTLLPTISDVKLNKYLKELAAALDWDKPIIKRRERRGEEVIIYKDTIQKTHFQLCDLITTHTMRRTAITTISL
ncbi:MAG: hypothetical protein KDC34_13935 [Saprospiraceae bacterium]|nr:hypothetical protein [Saprospiraceae bacterium]